MAVKLPSGALNCCMLLTSVASGDESVRCSRFRSDACQHRGCNVT